MNTWVNIDFEIIIFIFIIIQISLTAIKFHNKTKAL